MAWPHMRAAALCTHRSGGQNISPAKHPAIGQIDTFPWSGRAARAASGSLAAGRRLGPRRAGAGRRRRFLHARLAAHQGAPFWAVDMSASHAGAPCRPGPITPVLGDAAAVEPRAPLSGAGVDRHARIRREPEAVSRQCGAATPSPAPASLSWRHGEPLRISLPALHRAHGFDIRSLRSRRLVRGGRTMRGWRVAASCRGRCRSLSPFG